MEPHQNFENAYWALPGVRDPLAAVGVDNPAARHHQAIADTVARAQLAAFRTALTQVGVADYRALIDAGMFDDVCPWLPSLRAAADDVRNKDDLPLWFLVTINPRPEVTLTRVKEVVAKVISKVWITEFHYAYEQRGKTEEDIGKGFHVHLLIKRAETKTRWSHIKRELGNTAGAVCDIANAAIFNIRRLKTDDDVKKAYSYVKGEKDTTGDNAHKAAALEFDKVWRRQHGLEDLYESCTGP